MKKKLLHRSLLKNCCIDLFELYVFRIIDLENSMFGASIKFWSLGVGGLRLWTSNVTIFVMPVSSDPVLLRVNVSHSILYLLKGWSSRWNISWASTGMWYRRFSAKVSIFVPKYIYQIFVAYKNSKMYRSVAPYQRGWQEGASSETPPF